MAEKTLHDEGGVVVTNTRFVVGLTTYPVNGITSVSSAAIPARTFPGKLLLGLGGLCAVLGYLGGGGTAWLAAVAAIALGVVGVILPKPRYAVAITTAGGQVQALVDRDAGKITRVVSALNEAIIQRG